MNDWSDRDRTADDVILEINKKLSTANSVNSNQSHLFIQRQHFPLLHFQHLLARALKYLVVLLSLIQKLVARRVLLMETFVHK